MPVRMWRYFYNFMHHSHVPSVLEHGLLSLNLVRELGIDTVDISNQEVQALRDAKRETVYHQPVHDYVPLYINPLNPMLYVLRHQQASLVMFKVLPTVLRTHDHVFTDGNAASGDTQFGPDPTVVEPSEPVLRAAYWNDRPDGARRRCAEVLVYERIEPEYITGAMCTSQRLAATLRHHCPFPVRVDHSVFF